MRSIKLQVTYFPENEMLALYHAIISIALSNFELYQRQWDVWEQKLHDKAQ